MADIQIEDVATLLRKLGAARLAMDEATEALSVASSDDINARNRSNAAQRDIDRWYDRQKKDAPRDTDWARSLKR